MNSVVENNYIEVYEGNILNVYLLKCILEKEDIRVSGANEIMNAMALRRSGVINIGSYKISVLPGDLDRATLLVEAFKNSFEN